MRTKPKLSIIDEKYLKNCFSVKLMSNGIIIVDFTESLREITKEHLVKLNHCIKVLGSGKKMPVYTSTYNFMNISSEARVYAASAEGQRYTIANAVLIDNLAKSILFNFYLKMNQPVVPTKAFKTEEEALIWLESLNNYWFN